MAGESLSRDERSVGLRTGSDTSSTPAVVSVAVERETGAAMSPFPQKPNSESFLQGVGSHFPQQDVVIIHCAGTDQEQRNSVRAIVQSRSAQFDLDTPIYEGDVVELEDPRGGKRRLSVDQVDINDVRGGPAFHGMSHISVKWSDARRSPGPMRGGDTTYNGPVVVVKGDHAQIAWDNAAVTQSSAPAQVAPGFEDLAHAVIRALKLLSTSDGIDADDRAIGSRAGEEVLQEIVKPAPDKSVVRRGLAALRGLLVTMGTSAAGAAARELIERLVMS